MCVCGGIVETGAVAALMAAAPVVTSIINRIRRAIFLRRLPALNVEQLASYIANGHWVK